ncbi:hypothetical protein SEVIR_4G000800v4 [Setaria viridis]|uniref:Uncharacterized protein n=1 Tax=Setaria viridis TaxID=4556 RepID=A0A4U6UV54_SETVI|nr:hypothetical protein SEVIR_4G000800v2 [Setaria viridis]
MVESILQYSIFSSERADTELAVLDSWASSSLSCPPARIKCASSPNQFNHFYIRLYSPVLHFSFRTYQNHRDPQQILPHRSSPSPHSHRRSSTSMATAPALPPPASRMSSLLRLTGYPLGTPPVASGVTPDFIRDGALVAFRSVSTGSRSRRGTPPSGGDGASSARSA